MGNLSNRIAARKRNPLVQTTALRITSGLGIVLDTVKSEEFMAQMDRRVAFKARYAKETKERQERIATMRTDVATAKRKTVAGTDGKISFAVKPAGAGKNSFRSAQLRGTPGDGEDYVIVMSPEGRVWYGKGGSMAESKLPATPLGKKMSQVFSENRADMKALLALEDGSEEETVLKNKIQEKVARATSGAEVAPTATANKGNGAELPIRGKSLHAGVCAKAAIEVITKTADMIEKSGATRIMADAVLDAYAETSKAMGQSIRTSTPQLEVLRELWSRGWTVKPEKDITPTNFTAYRPEGAKAKAAAENKAYSVYRIKHDAETDTIDYAGYEGEARGGDIKELVKSMVDYGILNGTYADLDKLRLVDTEDGNLEIWNRGEPSFRLEPMISDKRMRNAGAKDAAEIPEAALEKGEKVEKEHGKTYENIKAYYAEHGEFPPFDMVTEWIASDHLKEFADYYEALEVMEKELKAEKKEEKTEARRVAAEMEDDEDLDPELVSLVHEILQDNIKAKISDDWDDITVEVASNLYAGNSPDMKSLKERVMKAAKSFKAKAEAMRTAAQTMTFTAKDGREGTVMVSEPTNFDHRITKEEAERLLTEFGDNLPFEIMCKEYGELVAGDNMGMEEDEDGDDQDIEGDPDWVGVMADDLEGGKLSDDYQTFEIWDDVNTPSLSVKAMKAKAISGNTEKAINKAVNEYWEPKLGERGKRLINWLNSDLYHGPYAAGTTDEEGNPDATYPGFTSGIDEIRDIIDNAGGFQDMWYDNDSGELMEKEPEAYEDEETGEMIEPFLEETYLLEGRDVARYVLGKELVSYVI